MRGFGILSFSLLLAAGTARGQGQYNAQLNGASEIPSVPSAATGVGSFLLNANDTLTYYVTASGFGSLVTDAHIHPGLSTQSGGVLFPLTFVVTPGGMVAAGTTAALTAAQKTDLLAGALYVNVHTVNNGGGEIRGQIRAPAWADLNGANECLPMTPTGSGGFGAVVNANNSITWAIKVVGITGTPTDAHLHTNPGPCLGGPVNIGLIAPSGPAGGPWTSTGTTAVLTAAQINNLYTAGFYCNVHTTSFGGGALRGDTRGGVLPPSTPGGCAGTGGVTPSLGWMGGPARLTLPGPFGAHVSGALPGAASLLIIGVNNGPPFPLDLQAFFGGTGPCTVLSDFPITVAGSIAAAGVNAGHGHLVFPSLAGAGVGGTLYLQEAVFPDPASPLGTPVVLSNGLTITIQP
jgi:CHRD domain-containing protein